MLTNPAVQAYASIGDAEPKTKKTTSVESSSGLLSRSRNAKSNTEDVQAEPNEIIRGYVKQIRDKRRELKNG